MDLPQPPQDEEQRNIIDKLAFFVAKNGQEFETMTKQKQQGNPKFSFLYGGDGYNYYMYRLTTEQAILKHKARGPNPFEAAAHLQNRFPFDQHQGGGPGPPRHMSRFDRGPPPSGPGGFQGPGPGQFPPRMQFQQRFPPPPQHQGGFGNEFDNSFGGPGPGGGGPPPLPLRPQGMNPFEVAARHQAHGHGGRNRFDVRPPGFEGPGPGGGPPPGFQNHQNNFQQQPPPPTQQQLTNNSLEIEALKTQKQKLEEQIKQSEQNLQGQHQAMMVQQKNQIEEGIRIMQEAEVKQLTAELNINLNELDQALESVVDGCTKEAISGGKGWIFTHTSTPRHYQLLSMYLIQLTTDPEASFTKRLHIMYLVNDIMHHCMRKGAEDLRQVLEAMIIPMFSHAKVKEMGNEENLNKLDKLLELWEHKCQYVGPIAVEKLKDANNTWLEYHEELLKRHAVIVTQIAQNIQKTYEGYQAQHQAFAQHHRQNIQGIEQKLQQLIMQQQQQLSQVHSFHQPSGPPANLPPPGVVIPNLRPQGIINNSQGPPGGFTPILQPQFPLRLPLGPGPGLMGQEPPKEADVPIPDLSRPPPGFTTTPQVVSEKDLIPALPYYELPAGLMVPLVKPEDDNYKPINPNDIRLPPPCPPSERLIQAVEAFYAPPSHERPRDSEGWERLGLYEYYKSKNLARKQKEDDIREGKRQKSKSPSPIRRDSSPSGKSKSPSNRRRYQSKSPTPERQRKRSRSRSRSPRSRRNRRRSRSKSRSKSPARRTPTPPSFGMPGLGMEQKLDESNKGHQLLKKMGWGGTGLGANAQGIEAPIVAGEVRDRTDLYRGVGVPNPANDPFESYRKNKASAFIERMKARAEETPFK